MPVPDAAPVETPTATSLSLRLLSFRRAGGALLALVLVATGLSFAPANALAPTTADSAMWQVNGRVRAIVETPNAVYLGGQFTALIGPNGETLPRTNLAALDPTTGQPLPFVANVNKPVWGVAVSSDNATVYAVGDFNTANGITRKRAAAFSAADGAVTAWNPNLAARGLAVETLGSRVYIGGDFLTVGGISHAHLAAVDATTGAVLTGWAATANDAVETIVATRDGSKVFVGGLFTSISGLASRDSRKIAALNPTTGANIAWAGRPTYEVFDLEVSDTQLFAAAGGSGGHALAYNLSTGTEQWTGFGDGDAVSVEIQNGVLYIGGHMTTWGGVDTGHLIAVNPANGVRIPWAIKINSNLGIFSMASYKGHLSIGGDFTKVNNLSRQHYARFREVLDAVAPSTPGTPYVTASTPSSATVTWAASTDNVESSLIYTIYRDGGTTAVAEVTSAARSTVSFTDAGLALGSTHTWQVKASDGENESALSPSSDAFTLPPSPTPQLTGLQMLDNDQNGKADTVLATFSSNIGCDAPCTSPWTLTNVPSGGSLNSVTTSGRIATLTLNEGSGAQDTQVGAFTVALAASASGVVDAENDPGSFGATSPSDGAGPVPVSYESTDGTTANFMEPGDTFTAHFSEPIDPSTVIAANVKELDPAVGTDKIIIVGLTEGPMDLLDDGIVIPDKGTVVYQQSTLTMLDGDTTIRSTIAGPCTGSGACGAGQGLSSLKPVTFVPESTLKDVAGNQATGSFTGQLAIF